MNSTRFNDEQIIGALRDTDGQGNIKTVSARHNSSEAEFYSLRR